LVWDAESVEEIGLFACSMKGSASRGRKRKTSESEYAIGGFGSCPADAIVARAWVKPEKFLKTHHELLAMNLGSAGSGHLKISVLNLTRTLKANDLELVGDGECFRDGAKDLIARSVCLFPVSVVELICCKKPCSALFCWTVI
jgi:hypothetical protein